MKRQLTKLASLLLAIILTFSLTALAEEIAPDEASIVIEEAIIPEDTASGEALEMPEELDALILDSVIVTDEAEASATEAAPEQAPEGQDDAVIAANAADGIVSNAIPSSIKIGVKEKYTIDKSGLTGKVTFKSSKKKVATVSSKGVVTGKKAGSAKITIKDGSGTKRTLKVTVAKAPSKVKLNKTKATLTAGKTLQLKATLPSKTASYKRTWTSSNKKVATVSSSGLVTAVSAGTAKITVKTFNGKKATCKVTVKKAVNPFTVGASSITLLEDEEYTLKVTYTGTDDITFVVDDSSVVQGEWDDDWYNDGKVTYLYLTALNSGTTTIDIYDDSGNSIKVQVTVLSPLSVGRTTVNLKSGETFPLKVTFYYDDCDVTYEVDDSSVADCKWDEDWYDDNNVTYLYITGYDPGTTVVVVYDDFDHAIPVYVTVT